MDDKNITSNWFCENQILAELSFDNDGPQNQCRVVLLCTRLLANYSLSESNKVFPGQAVTNTNDGCLSLKNFESSSTKDLEDERITLWLNYWSENWDVILIESWPLKLESLSKEELYSQNICKIYLEHCKVQYEFQRWKFLCAFEGSEFFSNNPSTLTLYKHETLVWCFYWQQHYYDFVMRAWTEKYGSDGFEGHYPFYSDEIFFKHCEEQYYQLYLQYLKVLDEMNYDGNNNNDDESTSNSIAHSNEFDKIWNLEFFYKHIRVDDLDSRLISAYQTLSLIGYNFDNQQTFESATVWFLNPYFIKSTRHLNIYRFPYMSKPKKCANEAVNLDSDPDSENTIVVNDNIQEELLFPNNLSKENLEASVVINESKKVLQNEKHGQETSAEHFDPELERTGHNNLKNNTKLLKYWKNRENLFSLFDSDLDELNEGWCSVTPKIISECIAKRCSCDLLINAFGGCGGNTIQFAKTCYLVIAVDIDPKKIEIARHNAELYGVADRIQFIIGDYYALAPTLKADVVFLSPPWGGPKIMNLDDCKLSNIMAENGGGEHLLSVTQKITSNIALHLPKNINIFDCIKSVNALYVEVQQNVLNSNFNSVTVYYNDLFGLSDQSTVEYST